MNEDIISAVKGIIGITDTSLDTLIAFAVNRAELAILAYTGWESIAETYAPAWISLSIAYYNHAKYQTEIANGKQIKASQTQGSRSVSYVNTITMINTDGLTEEVRAMLPLPRLKVY